MAAANKSSNKELSALHRLEFFKKQNFWKLSNNKSNKAQAKSTTSTRTSLRQRGSYNLDKTYDVMPISDKETKSNKNTDFINKIPKTENLLSNLPPPRAQQIHEALKPAPQSSHVATRLNQMSSHLQSQIQGQQILHSTPINCLQTLLGNARDNQLWQKSDLDSQCKVPPPITPQINNPSHDSSGNKINSQNLQHSNNCKHQNQVMSAPQHIPFTWNMPLPKTILPQAPPADTLRQLLCPSNWQNSLLNIESLENQSSSVSEIKPNIRIDQEPNLFTSHMDTMRNFIQQTYPENPIIKNLQQSPAIDLDLFQGIRKTANKCLNNEYSEILTHKHQPYEESWNSPELLLSPQNMSESFNDSNIVAIEPNVWTNQCWLKQQQLLQNRKEWCISDDNHNDLPVEVNVTTFHNESDDQYGCEPPHPVENYYEIPKHMELNTRNITEDTEDTPQRIKEETEKCLQQFMALYKQNDDSFTGAELEYDVNQDVSTEFIREAHEVPHSSEKDPDETKEFEFSMIDKPITATLSTRNLRMMLKRSSKMLLMLLQEERLRNEIKRPVDVNLIEYPTRDTDPFLGDYILDGSHLPHDTTHLEVSEFSSCNSEGIIKINMGRPYRM